MLCRSRSLVLLLLAGAAFAQFRQDPIGAAIQDYYRLRNQGHHDEAGLARERIRALVDRAPLEAPQYVNWFQNVAQMYEQAGKNAEARSVAQAALARGNRLPDGHPVRVMLLHTLASSWQRDGHLLKALAYWEQVAAVVPGPAGNGVNFQLNPMYVYQQVAGLYRQLGRPEDAAAFLERAASRLRNDPAALASFYEQTGQLDQAEAQYKRLAEEAPTPREGIGYLQSLAGLYVREGRAAEGVAVQQQAIALAGSPNAPGPSQTFWLRWNLTSYLQQAGQTQAAEQVYQQLLSDPQGDRNSAVTGYANFLRSTDRVAQAEQFLTGYLENHPDLDPGMQANLFNTLAGLTRDAQRAENYRRSASEKTPASEFPLGSLQPMLQAAQQAAAQGRLDEAFDLTLEALAAAPSARDRDSIANWPLTGTAQSIGQKQPARAEEVYERLLAVTGAWTADTLQPLNQAGQTYLQFLMGRPDRYDAVPAAIAQHRAVIAAGQGEETAAREALDQEITLERNRQSWNRALFLAGDRLRLEESLSGTTSQPYLKVLLTLANLYESSGDPERALPLHRQAVKIADLTAGPNDPQQPVRIRMDAALAFARQRQFEEADRLAAEAMAMEKTVPHPRGKFTWPLDEIQRLEKAAATTAAVQ